MEVLEIINLPLWLPLLLVTAVVLYMYGTRTFSTWSSQNIPGPPPVPFFGNLREICMRTQFCVYEEWRKKYGEVYGFYRGMRPNLVVTDLSIIRQILMKNFSKLPNKPRLESTLPKPLDKSLLFVSDQHWKRLRSLVSPSLSSGKLRLISYYIKRCCFLLSQSFERKIKNNEDVELKSIFGAFTMDIISGTIFGLETNSLTEDEEPFVRHCRGFFESPGTHSLVLYYVVNAFPWIASLMVRLGKSETSSEHARFIVRATKQLMKERKRLTGTVDKRTTDILQTLMDLEMDPKDLAKSPDPSKPTSSRGMTEEEIISQAFTLLLGGYETTSSFLQFLTYNLTLFPEVQDKLFEEINNTIGEDEPTFENVSKLPYLNAVIKESMRRIPVVTLVERRANQTTTIEGITIPEGALVTIPVYNIMHDPLIFPDPYGFQPDRFLKENRDDLDPVLLDLPFGVGPRQCIGMRLALLEIRFCAVSIFRKFRFVKSSETPDAPELIKSPHLIQAVSAIPMKVKAVLRGE